MSGRIIPRGKNRGYCPVTLLSSMVLSPPMLPVDFPVAGTGAELFPPPPLGAAVVGAGTGVVTPDTGDVVPGPGCPATN